MASPYFVTFTSGLAAATGYAAGQTIGPFMQLS